MKHHAFESFDQSRRIWLRSLAQGYTAEALQEPLSLLGEHEIDKQFRGVRMSRFGPQHDAVEFDDHGLEIHPIHRVSLCFGVLDRVGISNRERKLSGSQEL